MSTKPATIDEYIATFPQATQKELQKVRKTIHEAAPDAQETISYGMPTFKLDGHYLVYFGGWEKHIGFYALPSGTAAFQIQLEPYKTGKGSAQFPLDKPIPHDLIKQMVKFRVQEVRGSGEGNY
jgi:uncharacterized protein YdhG (YjbR/CyaY superfamily)